ncbi:cell division protein FtsZ [Prolixibacteraceae bacterium JC049]|nr:cell division protein FtsZ [Prolixibacteraceae bacterium JC049]
MNEALFDFGFVVTQPSTIKVIGVGGGGCNVVGKMYSKGVANVDCIVCNTDLSALSENEVPDKVQLGISLTEGRGAGNLPERGEEAARESQEEIRSKLEDGTQLVFLVVCLGGGTGTGAAPVIAQIARELGIVTIAVVTTPALAEGKKRHSQAQKGLADLKNNVDSMLQIDGERLLSFYGDLSLSQVFDTSNELLRQTVRGLCNVITLPGDINIDFADVETVLAQSGRFLFGIGRATGKRRGLEALENALNTALLSKQELKKGDNFLLNMVTGDKELTMSEIGKIIDTLQEVAGTNADIIWGNAVNSELGDEVEVTLVVTGKEIKFKELQAKSSAKKQPAKQKIAGQTEEEPEKKNKSEDLINDWFFKQFNQLFDDDAS